MIFHLPTAPPSANCGGEKRKSEKAPNALDAIVATKTMQTAKTEVKLANTYNRTTNNRSLTRTQPQTLTHSCAQPARKISYNDNNDLPLLVVSQPAANSMVTCCSVVVSTMMTRRVMNPPMARANKGRRKCGYVVDSSAY
uniref:Uncharacterized protein n=1 Tax=Ceratitis capitata TaxID=7213 RepID=W8BJG3_CERCA